MKLLKFLALTVIGWFIVPFLLIFAIKDDTSINLTIGNSIWGNNQDGVDGDARWYGEWVQKQNWFIKMFPSYYWTAWRNPVENWRVSIGINGIIDGIHIKGDSTKTGHYRAVATIHTSFYTFHQWKWQWPIVITDFLKVGDRYYVLKYGPKIWDDTKIGDRVNNAFAFSIFKPFTNQADAGIV